MKLIFTLILIAFSVNVSAESPACEAIIDALGIDPVAPADGSLRRYVLKGKTPKDEACKLSFMPEFCTFEIGAPLESPIMYYLQDTDTSSINMSYREGEKFYFKSVTKETEASSELFKRKFIKVLNLKKNGKGLEVEFRLSVSRLSKKELAAFDCALTGPFSLE